MIEQLYKRDKSPKANIKAVTKKKCNRCLSTNIYKDNYGSYHCLDCYQYGLISDQMTIYRFDREIIHTNHILNMDYNLTELQEKGSKFLLDCYQAKEPGFLQAVCGAGKTEMTYKVILEALNHNQKVCFVIPRVQVLKEVKKRFYDSFPKTTIGLLYEGNKHYENAQLIFSTPQQLIYFYDEFDLIILDEVDAFPYSGNEFLKRLVKKSLKSTGVHIYMSATICEDDKEELKNYKTFLIPSRYHKRPLAIPSFIKIGDRKDIYRKIKKYLDKNHMDGKKTLLFVPTIKMGIEVNKTLQEKGYDSQFISSNTKYKYEVTASFRNNNFNFLVTTTVLERGVTFKDIDCFVLFADHMVFTKETLIQISGRVGRDVLYPEGQILFFSEYTSKAMKLAKNEIIYMNCRNSFEV